VYSPEHLNASVVCLAEPPAACGTFDPVSGYAGLTPEEWAQQRTEAGSPTAIGVRVVDASEPATPELERTCFSNALVLAAQGDHLEQALVLLEAGADPSRADSDGGTPRARSHCRFAPLLIRFIPDSLRESVSLFLR
jgi:hypothetical protein